MPENELFGTNSMSVSWICGFTGRKKVNPTHKEEMFQSAVLVFYPPFCKASLNSTNTCH